MALLNLFKFLSPFIPQTKIESAKVNEQFSKIADSMDTVAAALDRTPVYPAGTTFPSTANAGKVLVLDANGNPAFKQLGTAADLTATTSDTDSTAGRVLRVGNLGFGSQIAGIKEVYAAQTPADVLAVVGNNAHYTGNILNHGASAPEAWGIISGYITNGNSYSYSYEDFTGINGARYRRTAASASTWNTWRKVYEQGDLGSAAFLTAAEGQSDSTIGRALKVGDFSLGKTGALINLPVGTLDELNINGSFSVAGNTPGWPFGGSGGVLTHRSHGDGVFSVQEAAEAQSERIAVRFRQVTGSWTNWGFVYHARNALGTVAFSGGVNTGAIIERGSNPNGQFIKLADGTAIAWFLRTGSLGTTAYSGSLPGLRIGFFYWFYPLEFISAPAVSATGVDNISTGWASAQVSSGTQATMQYYTITTNPTDTLISCIAIGRWR
nr:MAG TPA: hypothetical protein [Caudoviricetes sp.]